MVAAGTWPVTLSSRSRSSPRPLGNGSESDTVSNVTLAPQLQPPVSSVGVSLTVELSLGGRSMGNAELSAPPPVSGVSAARAVRQSVMIAKLEQAFAATKTALEGLRCDRK